LVQIDSVIDEPPPFKKAPRVSRRSKKSFDEVLDQAKSLEPSSVNDDATLDTLDETEDDEKFISKSEAKRRSLALQKVGEELVALSNDALKKFNLPEELLVAILDAKRINPNKHGGMSRQMQYIGKRMREVDAAPIVARLAELKAPSQRQTALHHLAEQWRTRLLADPSSNGAFRKEFFADVVNDAADEMKSLDTLIAKTKEEQTKHGPPKHFRLLYKFLLKHIQARADAASNSATKTVD
jgi:ribosome-associated protein